MGKEGDEVVVKGGGGGGKDVRRYMEVKGGRKVVGISIGGRGRWLGVGSQEMGGC